MNKVICDICGTTYPDTSAQCPICGSARNTVDQTMADLETTQERTTTYTPVKGGRFSAANVRKRTGSAPTTAERRSEPVREKREKQDGSGKGLVVVIVILLIAIVAVASYIGIRHLLPGGNTKPNGKDPVQNTQQTGPSTAGTTAAKIPCTGLKLAGKQEGASVSFDQAGAAWLLTVEKIPVDTTDELVFQSADPTIAEVSNTGLITAVSGGETVITVTCGAITAECKVICNMEGVTQPTTEPTKPIDPNFVLKLNREDFTLTSEGATWRLFKDTETVKASDITWISEDETVATVENGKVTGVDYGYTTIIARYGDQEVKCVVRVSFKATQQEEGRLKQSHRDVTLKEGESFRLSLTDSQGVKVDVEWVPSEEGFLSIDGNKIKAEKETTAAGITLTATHEGKTYTCIVRVRNPKEETGTTG